MNSLILLAQASGAAGAGTNNVATNAWNWARVLEVHLGKGGLVVSVGPAVVAVVVVGALAAGLWWWRKGLWRKYDLVETTLSIGNIGEVKIQPNRETTRIAYQAWGELNTRKVALPLDEENDVIVEVYNSYYEAFGRLRDLAKSIPAHRLRQCPDTKKLVEVMVKVLNDGLRPHLTKWQARFRKWYGEALKKEKNEGRAPQDIQREFEGYTALVADLKALQPELVKYAEFLRQLAQGKEK